MSMEQVINLLIINQGTWMDAQQIHKGIQDVNIASLYKNLKAIQNLDGFIIKIVKVHTNSRKYYKCLYKYEEEKKNGKRTRSRHEDKGRSL